jgi:hypothetical protein
MKGIIVADKGFPPSKIEDLLKKRPELHFLTPIKRNDKRITENSMLAFEEVLVGIIATRIISQKCALAGGRFLYFFRDAKRAAEEEAGYLATAEKKRNFAQAHYEKKKRRSVLLPSNPTKTCPERQFTSVMKTDGT